MPTSLATLVSRTRRFVRDWPQEDALNGSITASATTLTVADGTLYADNWLLEIDQETLFVNGNGSGTTVTVRRGMRGTAAATHADQAPVLIRPHFLYAEVLDALNRGLQDTYPKLYKPVLDTSLTTTASTFEYTVPNMPGTYGGDTLPIPYLSKIELKFSGETDYREVRGWSVRRGSTPKIQFEYEPEASATIRVHGFGPFPDLATGDSLDALFPRNAANLLDVAAASFLLASGEAGRVRVDTGAVDDREQANRVGSSMTAANSLYQRFLRMLENAAMPPMPPHVKPTF